MSEYLEIYENGDRFGTISASGEVRIPERSRSTSHSFPLRSS